jgi:predicted transcriptional regulator
MSEKRSPIRGGIYAKIRTPEGAKAAARALYESRPGATIDEVAKEIGAPASTIRNWKADDSRAGMPWKPAPLRTPQLSGRAAEIANSHAMRLAELGPAAADEQVQREAEIATSDLVAADLRARVVQRHRVEWSGPRKLIYEAAKTNDYDKARLGKVMAETLTMVQAGERRSWGLNSEAFSPDPTIVVIERSAGPVAAEPNGEGDAS